MRKITLLFSAMVLTATLVNAQTVATFESLTLPHPDTFYVNYTASGSDVGFNNGLAHFPCIYDTSFGGYWVSGFAYSNRTDSVTSGFMNQYSAKTAKGYAGSNNYVVAYGSENGVKLNGMAVGKPVKGFYATNSTYAFNSMRDGDAFARKFHNGDWFKLTVHGFWGGSMLADSVAFYLADFRFPDSTMNYIVKDWRWVNLLPIGAVDSLQFTLTSSDTGMFGMNTPAYFCIDNFTTADSIFLGVNNSITGNHAARIFPVPATSILYVDQINGDFTKAKICDYTGNILETYSLRAQRLEINTSDLAVGSYLLILEGNGTRGEMKFIKQ